MAKKSKDQNSNGATDSEATETLSPAKKRAKASTKTAAKKSGSKAAAKKIRSRKTTPKKSKGYEPSDDEIRLRAYFIAERRAQMSLKGDPANDWLEARQQLREEADQRKAEATAAPE
ncbi:MAG: DUF2934 domain-containing protein [Verrucomicrobiota bacterium]|nr:DUF2934 domain-containing protein [Verrucomicrobiota bacterium]